MSYKKTPTNEVLFLCLKTERCDLGMKIKELQEKRSQVIADMKEMTEMTEERAFDATTFDAKEEEIKAIDAEIRALETVEKLTKQEIKQTEERKGEDDMELRKEILEGKEIKLEERTIANATTTETAKDLIQTDYASEVFKKMEYISPLFAQVRKIITNSPHAIPVQKGKLGKFVKTAELGEYVANKANFETVMLGAEKYTNLVVLSEEVINDNDYNLEKEMQDQLVEAFALTMDELIVKGDGTVEGLEGFKTKKVVQSASGVITADEIVDLFFKLPIQYRKKACWVINDDTAKALTKLRDAQDRPMLIESYNEDVFGSTYKLLGRPVIVNNNVDGLDAGSSKKAIFIVNLDQAMVVGLRKNLTIQKSNEALFLQDGVAIKANTRLDAKMLNEDACAFLETV
nr:phage major capsid protein [uncultured Romboutsia sp.]